MPYIMSYMLVYTIYYMTARSATSIADGLKVLFLSLIMLREVSEVSIIECEVERDSDGSEEESFMFVDDDILAEV